MGSLKRPVMDLKDFLLRKKVLTLYKEILRAIQEVPSKEDQNQLREWARQDFKSNKHHKNQDTIRLLLTYGQKSLKELQQNLALAK